MATTIAHLPALDDPYPLAHDEIDAFRRNGHVVVRGVCSPDEAAAYRPVFLDAVRARSAGYAPLEQRDTYGKAFLQIMNLWREAETYRRFTFARRFARIAADLLGVEAVRLYHDQALHKEPGGGHTPWHQDQYYWPLETDNTVTMWMPLVDISESMGTMHFASGSHREGYIKSSDPISDESEMNFDGYVKQRSFAVVNHGDMSAGDATFHAGLILHGAVPNASRRTREVMTIIYFPDGVKVMEPDNPHRQNDLDTWIPGGVPGQPAASPLNPVLYARR